MSYIWSNNHIFFYKTPPSRGHVLYLIGEGKSSSSSSNYPFANLKSFNRTPKLKQQLFILSPLVQLRNLFSLWDRFSRTTNKSFLFLGLPLLHQQPPLPFKGLLSWRGPDLLLWPPRLASAVSCQKPFFCCSAKPWINQSLHVFLRSSYAVVRTLYCMCRFFYLMILCVSCSKRMLCNVVYCIPFCYLLAFCIHTWKS